ncbi:MAG: glycolate oxidase iron-sulfur subunit [Gammaproteobacteria bacterium]|nr:MAG: glycolate oxidase iron-sulfur subunit [Gammaproteobacteria bacterium]
MQTKLPEDIIFTSKGQRAEEIIKSCVHCGFCLATCPTYQLTGNELDSPRGRIYLIKSALEGNGFDQTSIQHLDKCLTCRACESTCPSGVDYGELVDIGREFVDVKRVWWQKLFRTSVRLTLTSPKLFNIFGRLFRHSSIKTPQIKPNKVESRILLLAGCVQPSLAPNINHVTKNVLAKLNIAVVETKQTECCGALEQHLSAQDIALVRIKTNINNWHAMLETTNPESKIEAIISNASGCGVMVKDYPTLFEPDEPYFAKAKIVSEKTKDIAEYLSEKDLSPLKPKNTKLSYHAPCTLQHGQKLPGLVEGLLEKLGYDVAPITDSHLCCGSAGTYSIFQPKMAKKLRDNKIQYLSESKPNVIVTANIGCLMHLSQGTKIPVKHWIELLDN